MNEGCSVITTSCISTKAVLPQPSTNFLHQTSTDFLQCDSVLNYLPCASRISEPTESSAEGVDPCGTSSGSSSADLEDPAIDIEDYNSPSLDSADGCQATASPPLYSNAPINMAVSCLLIMTYAICHSLTGEAIAALLQLIRIHCPSPNKISKSLYHFRKYFQHITVPVKFYHFCSKCTSLLANCGGSSFQCPNSHCKHVRTIHSSGQIKVTKTCHASRG